MTLHPTGNQVHAGHNAQLAITVLHQLGIAQHGPEPTLQTNLAVLAHLQQGSDLLKFHGLAMGVEHLPDQFPAGDRIFVFFRLSVGVRVAIAFFRGH